MSRLSETMDSRDSFLDSVRQALGRSPGQPPAPTDGPTALFRDARSVEDRANAILEDAETSARELMSGLEATATEAGWIVARVASPKEAAQYVEKLARDLEAGTILRSRHPVVEELDLETEMASSGIEVGVMATDDAADEEAREEQRKDLRARATEADLGVTGVDYAIAETGSCVIKSRKGASRLVSLLPPVHVAIVRSGQVLPGLDEMFTLERHAFLQGEPGGYTNLISGPSRSADIEFTLVTGVHGPGETHLLLMS